MHLPESLCSECPNCNGTGSYFDTPQYRPGGIGMHSGRCRDCDGSGLLFTAEGRRLFDFAQVLKAYPKPRSTF